MTLFSAIVIWHGLGFLVAVIVFGISLATNLIADSLYGEGYYDKHKWPFAIALVFSAVICWFLGDYLRRREDRVVIDKTTGEELTLNQSQHSFFFIPMRWWGPILFVIAALVLIFDKRP